MATRYFNKAGIGATVSSVVSNASSVYMNLDADDTRDWLITGLLETSGQGNIFMKFYSSTNGGGTQLNTKYSTGNAGDGSSLWTSGSTWGTGSRQMVYTTGSEYVGSGAGKGISFTMHMTNRDLTSNGYAGWNGICQAGTAATTTRHIGRFCGVIQPPSGSSSYVVRSVMFSNMAGQTFTGEISATKMGDI